MAGLQVLEEEFSGQGFHVLGFYSDDFGSQGGSDGDIDACTSQYAVTFPQFAKDHVKDVDGAGPLEPQPVWKWLLSQPNVGPEMSLVPGWNFNKYLISRDGDLVAHWGSSTYWGTNPNDPAFDMNAIVVAIQAELAKP
jgi:glutathione peroxidase